METIISFLETFIPFVIVLGILVFVHELGHFLTAKRAGVKVLEFGFGYPPRLFAVRRNETDYSINLLPLGGFVRLLGEEDPSEPGSLASRGVWTRFVVLCAGSAMNAILAVALFAISFMVPRDVTTGPVVISEVVANSPAEMAGIKSGDTIVKINDRRIQSTADVSYAVHLNIGSETTVVLQRDRFTQSSVKLIPRWNYPANQGPMGVVISMPTGYKSQEAYPIWEAVPMGIRKSLDMLVITKNDLVSMAIRRILPEVAGPIGIAQMTGEVSRIGFGYLVEFAGLLSINLAVMNMLPIPMLDGGRVFFVLLEGVRRGRRIPAEKEAFVHMVGMALLLGFVALISYYDILRIIKGESLFR
ncbi:MAG: RIP metalloprotease RseP [Dehalococcoidia bacterium]|nr:RIP metalloprotease RseP [Dehalococcoidia bacterium]